MRIHVFRSRVRREVTRGGPPAISPPGHAHGRQQQVIFGTFKIRFLAVYRSCFISRDTSKPAASSARPAGFIGQA
jgi:hypothetical protein